MLPNIFWSRTDYISGAYATKMVAISSPAAAITWLNHKLKKLNKNNLSLSFSPSLAPSYLFEQCLRLGVTSTSSVCLFEMYSLYVFPNCKSLRIKASAKRLNLNYSSLQSHVILQKSFFWFQLVEFLTIFKNLKIIKTLRTSKIFFYIYLFRIKYSIK